MMYPREQDQDRAEALYPVSCVKVKTRGFGMTSEEAHENRVHRLGTKKHQKHPSKPKNKKSNRRCAGGKNCF